MGIACAVYRGGTSKPALLLASDLPKDPQERDRLVLRLFGSPDARQIDGIGGGDPLTSKVAYVASSSRPDCDIEYTMGYVGLDEPFIDYTGNCGNSASAIGPFALRRGLIGPTGRVRMFNTNLQQVVEAEFVVKDGQHDPRGEVAIAGVPGTGSPVYLTFHDPADELLPTGNARDVLEVGGASYEVSIVDAVDPVIFLRTEEEPSIEFLQQLRAAGAERAGLELGPALPKVAVVRADEAGELHAWTLALNTRHKAYAVTGSICLAAAAKLPGTVVPDVEGSMVRFQHPAGAMEVELEMAGERIAWARVLRTARLIFDGTAEVD